MSPMSTANRTDLALRLRHYACSMTEEAGITPNRDWARTLLSMAAEMRRAAAELAG